MNSDTTTCKDTGMNYYIGYSCDNTIRYIGSSGGIGTALIKYLLETKAYGTAMTFKFNTEECQYYPQLIYDYSDYNNCGSIYQDTDNIGFIKNNLKNIKNGIIVTCMPCQVSPIKNILDRNNIKHFIISLCCSGQTTVEGTWYYYKLLGVDKCDVVSIRYRGEGWPSGIRIELKNGDVIKKDNWTYPWTLMHESLLFRPKRCIYCTVKTSPKADVSLADPWLKEYIINDRIGNTVALCNECGNRILKEMQLKNLVHLLNKDERDYIESQLGTIEIKSRSNQHKLYNKIVVKMLKKDGLYKNVVTSLVVLMKIHIIILGILKKLLPTVNK